MTASLEAYIPRSRRRSIASGVAMPDRVRGAALFADISGFTALTEALAKELGPQRGAEVLTHHLNRVFHALVEELESRGGDVICCSGGAVTCWIDGDDGVRAAACGLAMQETMDRLGQIATPGGTRVRLAMKVAIAAGNARRFVVGDPEIQLMDVLAGRLIDALAVAERGEVVLERSALESVGDRAQIREVRSDETGGGVCAVVARMTEDGDRPPGVRLDDVALPPNVAKGWLLPEVYERLVAGRGEFLAELRPAYPMFVNFGGIDYDQDEEAIGKLDTFVRQAQKIVRSYGGNLLQLTLGDKGAYLYAVFGSPIPHEDDAARAAHAALALRALPATTAATGIRIGIAHGRLRSGTYGHERRLAFTRLGDAVNLAARLMSEALPGQIYVAESVHAAIGEAFIWEALPAIALKGKTDRVAVYALVGAPRAAARAAASDESALVGRTAELAAMVDRLEAVLDGRGAIVAVSGEAGIRKSRLVAEVTAIARQRGVVVAMGECQSYGNPTSYFVWREIWSALLRIDRGRRARKLHGLSPVGERERRPSGKHGVAAQRLFDAQALVPLRHALRPRERTDFELSRIPADREVRDREVFGLTRAGRHDRSEACGLASLQCRVRLGHRPGLVGLDQHRGCGLLGGGPGDARSVGDKEVVADDLAAPAEALYARAEPRGIVFGQRVLEGHDRIGVDPARQHVDHRRGIEPLAIEGERILAVATEFRCGDVERQAHLAAGLEADLFDRSHDRVERFFVRREDRPVTAFVGHTLQLAASPQGRSRGAIDLRSPVQRLGERARAGAHDHEVLDVDSPFGVDAAAEDLDLGKRQPHASASGQMPPQRNGVSGGAGMQHRHRGGHDRVAAETAPVIRSVEAS